MRCIERADLVPSVERDDKRFLGDVLGQRPDDRFHVPDCRSKLRLAKRAKFAETVPGWSGCVHPCTISDGSPSMLSQTFGQDARIRSIAGAKGSDAPI